MKAGTWPSVDHSLLSPSGHMSKAARKRANKREYERLFGDIDFTPKPSTDSDKAKALIRQAAFLRGCAARGMHVRSYPKEAARLEAEADKLVGG